jgi:hypothetical protein
VDISRAIAFLEAVFGALRPEDRVSDADLNAAELRLALRLPASLRTLYALTGSSHTIHRSHNKLVRPERIDFGDDHLIFYEENQAVVVWAIARSRLSSEDPPVDQGQYDRGTGRWTYYPEFRSVAEFECGQAAWQAVQGGLPYVGVRDGSGAKDRRGEIRPSLEERLGPPELVTDGMSAWLVEGGVALELPGGYLGLATRAGEQFKIASARIGLAIEEWDYATLRDEPDDGVGGH